MTQADLASALRVGKAVINGYETGRSRPSLRKLDAILRVLRVDALELARAMRRVDGNQAAIRKRRYRRPSRLPLPAPADPRAALAPVERFLHGLGAAVADRLGNERGRLR